MSLKWVNSPSAAPSFCKSFEYVLTKQLLTKFRRGRVADATKEILDAGGSILKPVAGAGASVL